MKTTLLFIALLFCVRGYAQTPDECRNYFQSAAKEFDVPLPVLEAIGYVQTRWTQITCTPEELANRSPAVQPPVFGVMGLRDDNWFGHSLDSAAKLIGMAPDSLKDDVFQNIRGAAALLSRYRDETNKDSLIVTGDPSSWANVIARFSGIPQWEIALEFAYHTLQYLQMGVDRNGIVIPPMKVNLDNFPNSVKEHGFRTKQSSPQKANARMLSVTGGMADYPGANWVGSPNYGSRNGAPVVFVIVHDTEGPFDASVSWLQNPAALASSHYIIRSQDGYIDQLVHDADMAWGVRCWNPITLSIEHEGYVTDSTGKYFTETMYESSAHLTQYLCDKFKIPEDSLHIFGHDAWTYTWFNLIPFYSYVQYVGTDYATCNNHTDPGKYWKWHHYFDLIHSYDTTRPFIAATAPSSGDSSYPAYSNPVITFNTPMDTASVDSALTITPNLPVSLSFDQSYTQLTISHPGTLLAWSTTYEIKIDSSARALNGLMLDKPYSLTFSTVPKDTTGASVIAASPHNGGTSVSKAYIEFILDPPILLSSFSPSMISFTDSTGKSVAFSKDKLQTTTNNLTLIAVRASSPLIPGMKYHVTLAAGLVDYYNVSSKTPYSISFTVDSSEATGGNIIEDFETSLGSWIQPSASSNTSGVDPSSSSFNIGYRSYDGNGAGILQYQFDSAAAVCAEENSQGFDVSKTSSVGMWIFGDNSRNELDFIFGSSTAGANGPEQLVPIDTIDWYGYKYIGMWHNGSDQSTDILKGFAIKRLNSALFDGGVIYVDDIQLNGKVTGIRSLAAGIPASFRLLQNYPNPFNPTTVIGYEVRSPGLVVLKVYDVLGREVATLVNERQDAGYHGVTFNAPNLPSGVYFYRIIAGSYSSAKKMVMMK